MVQIIFVVVLVASIYLMGKANKQVPVGQISEEPLTKKEKIATWILCFFDPIISGAIFYYGWRKKLPVKAKQANLISLLSFLIFIGAAALAVFSGLIEG